MRALLLYLTVAGSLFVSACDSDQSGEAATGAPETHAQESTAMPSDAAQEESAVATLSEETAELPDTGDVGMSIVDRDGNVRLVLTPSSLYMRLSETTLENIRTKFGQRGFADQLKEAVIESVEEVVIEEVQNAVREGVRKMTKFRIAYDLDEIGDVRYEQGRLWIDVLREKAVSFDDIRVGGNRPALANFDQREAERFVETFQRLKNSRSS